VTAAQTELFNIRPAGLRTLLNSNGMSAPVFANAPEALGSASDSRLPGSLESEIRFIYAHSPLYAQRFPLHAEPLRWACYREIPVLTKQEILDRGPAAFFTDYGAVERGLRNREFEYEHTSGSTARPMTVIMGRRALRVMWVRTTVRSLRPLARAVRT